MLISFIQLQNDCLITVKIRRTGANLNQTISDGQRPYTYSGGIILKSTHLVFQVTQQNHLYLWKITSKNKSSKSERKKSKVKNMDE